MATGEILIKTELRPCVINGKEKGMFHQWERWQQPIGESPMIGGHGAGQVSRIYALVENEEGQMNRYEPESIKFVDNKVKEYAFGGKQK